MDVEHCCRSEPKPHGTAQGSKIGHLAASEWWKRDRLRVSAGLLPWRPTMNEPTPTSRSIAPEAAIPAAAGQTKVAAVLALLEVERGATLEDLVVTTGWQKHTARAVLSGLKKKGHNLEREKVNGVSRYRITKVAGK